MAVLFIKLFTLAELNIDYNSIVVFDFTIRVGNTLLNCIIDIHSVLHIMLQTNYKFGDTGRPISLDCLG